MNFNQVKNEDAALIRKLKLPPISQLGIIIPDIQKGVDYYSCLLNIKKWYRTKINYQEYFYQGRPIDQELNIVVGYSGKVQFELIQVNGKDENIYSAVLGKGGAGFHHFGVTVSNVEKKVQELEHAGIKPLQTGILRFGRGGVTKFAYLDTMERAGFILELIETRAFGINMGMPRWLVSLGRFTGDTESIKYQGN
jgi:hypothetical protein